MLRVRFVFASIVLAFLAAQSQGQFTKKTTAAVTPASLAAVILPGIDDPAIVADLKLAREQLDALVERRQATWDEIYNTPLSQLPAAKTRADATEAVIKKVLTAEQYRRAEQIGGQRIIRDAKGFAPNIGIGVPTAATLNRYPELVKAFKLTDEQKNSLSGGFFVTPGITAEQHAAALEYFGPALAGWTGKTDPRMANRPGRPGHFALLESKDVRAELKLTDDQNKVLADLRLKWKNHDDERGTPFFGGGGGPGAGAGGGPAGGTGGFGGRTKKTTNTDLSPKEIDGRAAVLQAETSKALTGFFTPQQETRLEQLAYQSRHGGRDLEQLYKKDAVVKELGLTEAQVKELDGIREEFDREAIKVLQASESSSAAQKQLIELARARRGKSNFVATSVQTAKLKALVGEPFVGDFRPSVGGFGESAFTANTRANTFGFYTTEFVQLATNKSIQKELKMTAEQINQAYETRDDLADRFVSKGGFGDTAAANALKLNEERSKAIEAALAKVLSAEQAARFRQIMMQAREFVREPASSKGGFVANPQVPSAITYPGVAEAVKLTDDQKRQLIGGISHKEVLTADQLSAIAKMLGEPFKGEFTVSRTTPAPTTPAVRTVLPTRLALLITRVGFENVEKAILVTPEQSKLLAAARGTYKDAAGVPPGGKFNTADAKTMSAAIDALQKSVADILTADQNKRLDQLVIQTLAAANLYTALTAANTSKTLELTAEQTAKLADLNEDAGKLQTLKTSYGVPDPENKLARQMHDAADERLLAVLTPAQQTRWHELTGDPWEGLPRTLPRRGPTKAQPKTTR